MKISEEKLCSALARKGLTCSAFCARVGVSESSLRELRCGGEIGNVTLYRFSQVLGVGFEDLIELENVGGD